MKVAMWTLELGLSRQVVEVAPVARPGHTMCMWTWKIPGRSTIITIIIIVLKYIDMVILIIYK
jgi:hypothetical protein